jgi:hypothetical protein
MRVLVDRDDYVTKFVSDALPTMINTLSGAPLTGQLREFTLRRTEREDAVGVLFTLTDHPGIDFTFEFNIFEEGIEPVRGTELDAGVFYSALVERVRRWERTASQAETGRVAL